MKKIKIIIICLIVLIISIILLIVFLNSNNTSYQKEEQSESIENMGVNALEVSNPHMYLTVKSCIEKYITYVYQEDTESVYKILDDNYIKKFNIEEENVLEFVKTINNPVTLSIEEMLYITIDDNNEEYFVLGTIKQESIDNIQTDGEEFCVTVKLDKENMIYSIIPYGYGGPLYEKE